MHLKALFGYKISDTYTPTNKSHPRKFLKRAANKRSYRFEFDLSQSPPSKRLKTSDTGAESSGLNKKKEQDDHAVPADNNPRVTLMSIGQANICGSDDAYDGAVADVPKKSEEPSSHAALSDLPIDPQMDPEHDPASVSTPVILLDSDKPFNEADTYHAPLDLNVGIQDIPSKGENTSNNANGSTFMSNTQDFTIDDRANLDTISEAICSSFEGAARFIITNYLKVFHVKETFPTAAEFMISSDSIVRALAGLGVMSDTWGGFGQEILSILKQIESIQRPLQDTLEYDSQIHEKRESCMA